VAFGDEERLSVATDALIRDHFSNRYSPSRRRRRRVAHGEHSICLNKQKVMDQSAIGHDRLGVNPSFLGEQIFQYKSGQYFRHGSR
jgi:hypothetical protein